jgi:fumarate reductase subunit C
MRHGKDALSSPNQSVRFYCHIFSNCRILALSRRKFIVEDERGKAIHAGIRLFRCPVPANDEIFAAFAGIWLPHFILCFAFVAVQHKIADFTGFIFWSFVVSTSILIVQSGLAEHSRKSRWPARLDLLQSGTGLLLALFMWGHMVFVASILFGKTAMWSITRMFEGYFFFGGAHPRLVSGVVAGVLLLFVLHALLALRKFPADYRQYRTLRAHVRAMRHGDSALWIWQVYTGFALFFLASAHLYQMLLWPQNIGPYASADRVWSDGLWPFYLLMLLAVEVHGGIGLYRLAMKWNWPRFSRNFLKGLKWGLTGFFLILGLLTLGAYMKIGFEHQARYGERYQPAELPAWLERFAPEGDFSRHETREDAP